MRLLLRLDGNRYSAIVFSLAAFFVLASAPPARGADPWTPAQILKPADLARQLAGGERKPLVLQVGFQILYKQSHIPGAEYCGPARDPEGIAKLRKCVEKVPRTKEVVIYCGCCPFKDCPNVRPAFAELKKLGIKNLRVLEIPHTFGEDWVKKGYPVARGE
jgi:thiosulfate/3-mercaptopyruvate sulfurtransferase